MSNRQDFLRTEYIEAKTLIARTEAEWDWLTQQAETKAAGGRPSARSGPEESSCELITQAEAAKQLRISPRTLKRWEEKGRLRRVNKLPGGIVRYRREDVNTLIGQ